MSDHSRTTAHAAWVISPALVGAVIVGLVCVIASFVLSRVEPALIGAPLLLAAALGWDRRPRGSGAEPVVLESVVEVLDAPGDADGSTAVRIQADVRATERPDALQLRLAVTGAPPMDVVVTPRSAARLRAEVPVAHSGPQRIVAVTARALGADGAWVSEPGEEASVSRAIRPRWDAVRSLPLPLRLLGLTGQHVSTRPGEGGEFRDIDLFHPGDRLRRIDWKATARAGHQGELYVRRTTATSDAAVHLVIDARDDLTGIVADWSRAYPRPAVTSLDLAREAAGSLAMAYSAAGDRVGFDDLSDAGRVLPPRPGARHRERVLRAVELTGATGSPNERARAPRLSPGALVFVLSTFLDDQAVNLALTWRAAGHRVIAVDVLPERDRRDLTSRERLALRTIELERRLRLGQLTASGAEIVAWGDAGDRAARLRALTRVGSRR
jgi:uncharacterized protein (DUF58 family)